MSLQISPWSTHSKNFRAAPKKKSASKTTRKLMPTHDSKLYEPKTEEKLSKVQSTLTMTVTQYVKVNTEPEPEKIRDGDRQQPVQIISEDLMNQKKQVEALLEEKVLLTFIQQDLIKKEAIALLLPIIKQKSTELGFPRLNEMSFKSQTINTRRQNRLTDRSKAQKQTLKALKSEDKQKSPPSNSYDPFDDNEIMKRGLAFLRSQKGKHQNKLEDITVRFRRR